MGPLELGAAGAEYFLTIVDMYTRMTWVYMLFKKSDVAETVRTDWLPMVERQQDRLVKAIRTNRGGEFLGKEFSLWLKKNAIRHSFTMPYFPAMNGIAEQTNRTITETARGLLIEAGLPDFFWRDAVQIVCVAKNRALTHVGVDKWVPYLECYQSFMARGNTGTWPSPGWSRSKKPLELVHMDLVGPLPVQGHKGERYFLTIVDDWSRLMWAYLLKQKDHAASRIKEDWLPFVEKQAECVVKRIRTDRGGEFLGAEMTAWLKKQGIQRELTTAYTPQSNGVAERANRTIQEIARALLIESGVGNSMWPHAVRHATVARNRVLTKVGNESWVPLERWLGRKPAVDMLRVFGCMAVAHVPKKYRSKLGASAIWCVHLGLAAESKGWLLWEPSKGVLFDSRDVKFVEGMMYWGWKKQPETKVSQQMEQITMQLDLTPSVWEEGEEAAAEGGDGEKVQEAPGGGGDDVETSDSTKEAAGSEGGEQQLGKAKVPALPSRRKPKGVVMRGWETPVSRPGRTRMATMKLTAGADVAEQQLGNEEALLILPHGYDPDEEDEPAYCFLAPAPEEPASMEEALAVCVRA
ncbi:unnamed protein product [Closterium sp. NIES-54]